MWWGPDVKGAEQRADHGLMSWYILKGTNPNSYLNFERRHIAQDFAIVVKKKNLSLELERWFNI